MSIILIVIIFIKYIIYIRSLELYNPTKDLVDKIANLKNLETL